MASVGVLIAGLTGFAAYLYGPTTHATLTKVGAFRSLSSSPLANPADLIQIEDTVQCEDIHYYAPAHTLFTACEDVSATRYNWFPPLANYHDPSVAWSAKGSIHTIDPNVSTRTHAFHHHHKTDSENQTKLSKRLTFENFEGPFITHGIDVIPDPEKSENEAVYIFAINHVPNEAFFPRDGSKSDTKAGSTPKAASRIEVFHHNLGSDTVRHVNTITHPLIKTPNDIFAVSPAEIYVTNDHYYFEGHLRMVEDLWPAATWSNVIHATVAADRSINADVAVDKFRNANGFGHGRTNDEVLLASAIGGRFWIGKLTKDNGALELQEPIELDSCIDNPSWFTDPYASDVNGDASGFVLGGLTRALDSPKTVHDPKGREGVVVWYVTPSKNASGDWDKKLLWQDDGSKIRNAATAVLVGIDPKEEGGKRKAWLFVTGFSSEHTVAVKVDLA